MDTIVDVGQNGAASGGSAPIVVPVSHDVPVSDRQAKVLARIIATLALHTERAARWVVMLVACTLFAVALVKSALWYERLAVASVFAAMVFLPLWWRTLFPKGAS